RAQAKRPARGGGACRRLRRHGRARVSAPAGGGAARAAQAAGEARAAPRRPCRGVRTDRLELRALPNVRAGVLVTVTFAIVGFGPSFTIRAADPIGIAEGASVLRAASCASAHERTNGEEGRLSDRSRWLRRRWSRDMHGFRAWFSGVAPF